MDRQREGERRFRVYEEAPGFRPGPVEVVSEGNGDAGDRW